MNKQYLNKLNERLVNGEKLTKTERSIALAYRDVIEHGFDWIGIRKVTDIEPEELVKIMLTSDINIIYIMEEWSGQFENWYKMQEAGLEMVGMRKIDNPIYKQDIKRWGNSDNKETKIVLVFKIK
jgi:hypothetical protein